MDREALRAALLEVLELRFREVPDQVVMRVRAVRRRRSLRVLLRAAGTAPGLEEFEVALIELLYQSGEAQDDLLSIE